MPTASAGVGGVFLRRFRFLDSRGRGEADARLGRLMQDLWLAFAKQGAPAAAGIDWPTFDDGRATVLRLSDQPGLIAVPRREHLQFVDV